MTLKAIDLFSGAGGFTLSAKEAKIKILAAIEIDDSATKTYRKNFLNKKENILLKEGKIDGDINNIDPLELRKKLDLKTKELDIILGGPPCQGFSTHRIKDKGIDDPRNNLLLRYFDFVNEFKPKVFLVENVSGLLWARHKDYLNKFISISNESGYNIKFCDIVNAKDYGVPQNRKRVFIYGVRNDIDNENIIFPPNPTHFSFESGKKPTWTTASIAFESIPTDVYEKFWTDYFQPKTKLTQKQTYRLLQKLKYNNKEKEGDPCNLHMKPSHMMLKRFYDTPLNGSREDAGVKHQLKCHSNGYKGHKDVYGRIYIHLPSNTITTGCNNPSKGRYLHPWKNHGITLREAARLQTFPDWFDFIGNATEQAKQIGNAVPPLLGKKLIEQIKSDLMKSA